MYIWILSLILLSCGKFNLLSQEKPLENVAIKALSHEYITYEHFCADLTVNRVPKNLNAEAILREGPFKGLTLLHAAAASNNEYVIRYLISSKGMNVNCALPRSLVTPLHIAAAKNYSSLVVSLFRLGARLDMEDQDGNNPLHIAIKEGSVRAALVIIECAALSIIDTKGVLVAKDAQQLAPIHLAMLLNQLQDMNCDVFKMLLTVAKLFKHQNIVNAPDIINVLDKDGLSIAHHIANNPFSGALVDFVISNGYIDLIDFNKRSSSNVHPITYAFAYNQNMVPFFIDRLNRGAFAPNGLGNNLMHLAAAYNQDFIIPLLNRAINNLQLDGLSLLEHRNNSGVTPLDLIPEGALKDHLNGEIQKLRVLREDKFIQDLLGY